MLSRILQSRPGERASPSLQLQPPAAEPPSSSPRPCGRCGCLRGASPKPPTGTGAEWSASRDAGPDRGLSLAAREEAEAPAAAPDSHEARVAAIRRMIAQCTCSCHHARPESMLAAADAAHAMEIKRRRGKGSAKRDDDDDDGSVKTPSPPPSFLPMSLPVHVGSFKPIASQSLAARNALMFAKMRLSDPEPPEPSPPEPEPDPPPALSSSLSAVVPSLSSAKVALSRSVTLALQPPPAAAAAPAPSSSPKEEPRRLGGPSFACPCCDHEVESEPDLRLPSGPGEPSASPSPSPADPLPSEADLWNAILLEAAREAKKEPDLAAILWSSILSHRNLYEALSAHLADKLANATLRVSQLIHIINNVFDKDAYVRLAIRTDLVAVRRRDPACRGYWQPLLQFTGFQALQAYRVAHSLWVEGRFALAHALQSLISDVFHVDIHPAARIGKGILIDHAIGVVIGETAVVGDRVSILHNVTLGGNGIETGDRHPKIGHGVLLGARVAVLGNVRVGVYAQIAAGSVVLHKIPPRCVAVGVPARVVEAPATPTEAAAAVPPSPAVCPADAMDHSVRGLDLEDFERQLESRSLTASPTPRASNICNVGLTAVVFNS